MDYKRLFELWLLEIKEFSEKKVKKIITVFSNINNFLKEHNNKGIDIFSITDSKKYNEIVNEYIETNIAKNYLKNDRTYFSKNRKLYAEFLEDNSSIELLTKKHSEELNQTESKEENISIGKGAVTGEQLSSKENSAKKKSVCDNKSVNNQTVIDVFVDNTNDILSRLFNKVEIKETNKSKNPASLFFDLENEIVLLKKYNDSEKASYDAKKSQFYSYTLTDNGRVLKKDRKSVCYYENNHSAYSALYNLNEDDVKNFIIERSIHDIASKYKVDSSDLFCMMPDIIDDFNKDIRHQIDYDGKKLFVIPKSVAAMLYLQGTSGLTNNEDYTVIDFDGEEVSATRLSTHYLKDNDDKIVIVRKGLCKLTKKYDGYSTLIRNYLDAYCEKYNLKIPPEIRENLCKTKVLTNSPEVVVPVKSCYIVIKSDNELYNREITKVVNDSLKSIYNELSINTENTLVICSYVQGYYSYVNLGEGCFEVQKRIKNNEFLWEEYLPELSLEVVKNGTYDEIELIHKNEFRDVLQVINNEEIIKVDGTITLTAGKDKYNLPLKRSIVGSINKEKEAYLTSNKFPLSEDVEVKMEIHYQYGNEDSYKLIFYPINEAPFDSIANQWIDPVPVEQIGIPQFEEISQDMETDKVLEISEALENAYKKLEDIEYIDDSVRVYQNKATLKDEINIYYHLNIKYKYRRLFFSPNMLKNRDIKASIEEMFFNGMVEKMINIIEKKHTGVLSIQQKDVLIDNTEVLLSDFSVFYCVKINDEYSDLINRIITHLKKRNKLRLLVPASRFIKNHKDYYGIFDAISKKIVSKGNLQDSNLRTLSNNCWYCKDWIKNLYESVDGKNAIECIKIKTIEFIMNYDINEIYKKDYNPRKIRDMLELLLCMTRANQYKLEDDGTPFFDPMDSEIKDLVNKIKLIDKTMNENKRSLKYEFKSRLGAHINQGDLKNVNEISYMLIQTLTGKENIQLVGFSED